MREYLRLKKSNCKNCYKCIRHCPVKSIRFSNHQAHIVGDECILCGQCFVVCPQNAKEIRSDICRAKELLAGGGPVVASVAPSFVANYDGVSMASMEQALCKLGFFAAEETAIGAAIVKSRYEEMIRQGGQEIIISSCCHTVNLMVQKYFPEALPYLARVISPMQAHCRDIKKRFPGAKTVYIGPCISKKAEADESGGAVDCALTFEELSEWLDAEEITFEAADDTGRKSISRLFPTPGGIIKSMLCDFGGYAYLSVDGPENCIRTLRGIAEGAHQKCFIEMSACSGSCIGGPIMEKERKNPVLDYIKVARFAGGEEFDIEMPPAALLEKNHPYLGTGRTEPGHAAIEAVLRKMGKTRPEDELNCGSCGYNSCREKAAAVCQGKADLTMCLPFLKERAESFSDNIIQNTPNGIIVLNESLKVQQINDAALAFMNIRAAGDVLGGQVMRLMDPADFIAVMESGQTVRDKRVYLAEYKKYAELTVIYDQSFHILICIMRDVTKEETEHQRKEEQYRQTAQVTDRVVDKQMRVVQEIASLLGETAAETKIALTRLKESMGDE
jgi:iron only hydrogenase large subunit-like protein